MKLNFSAMIGLFVIVTSLAAPMVMAQTPAPGAVIGDLANSVQTATSIQADSFVADVVQVITTWKGGIPLGLKIACVVLLVIASMKVSFLNQLIWNKLGKFQTAVAPLLGLILGVTLLGTGGPLTLAAVFAYLASGAGAIALHELLDMVKAIPGLGAIYVTLINVIEGALGGQKPNA